MWCVIQYKTGDHLNYKHIWSWVNQGKSQIKSQSALESDCNTPLAKQAGQRNSLSQTVTMIKGHHPKSSWLQTLQN